MITHQCLKTVVVEWMFWYSHNIYSLLYSFIYIIIKIYIMWFKFFGFHSILCVRGRGGGFEREQSHQYTGASNLINTQGLAMWTIHGGFAMSSKHFMGSHVSIVTVTTTVLRMKNRISKVISICPYIYIYLPVLQIASQSWYGFWYKSKHSWTSLKRTHHFGQHFLQYLPSHELLHAKFVPNAEEWHFLCLLLESAGQDPANCRNIILKILL